VLDENELLEFVEGKTIHPTDLAQLASHLKKDVKARRIIVDGVKHHIIPHLSGKKETIRDLLMGINDTPSTGRLDLDRGCLINPSHLV
jgi:hypothetical protein